MITGGRVASRTSTPSSDAKLALVEATLAVIMVGGIRDVTLASVTRAAGLAETAVIDHFTSVEDLLEAVIRYLDTDLAKELARCEGQPDPIAAFAVFLVGDFDNQRARTIAEYELFVYASRMPATRPLARQRLTALSDLVSTWTESRRATRTIVAYADGLRVQALVSGERLDAKVVEATIKDLL